MEENKKNIFPKGFFWGTSTASYQIEGGNSNSDWWQWEERGKTKDKSGTACDYWNRWPADHELLSQLGVNAFRLSLEWSRIEPREGEFSQEAIEKYRAILQDLKNRNIQTIVTFWHWTSPIWFQEKYGWHKKESVEIFARYGKKIIDELGNLIDVAVVINEPMMPLVFGYLNGKYPPGIRCPIRYCRASKNLSTAYKKVYAYSKEKKSALPVGITMLYNFFEPANKYNPLDQLIVWVAKKFWNESFFQKIKNQCDYYGLDYYFHRRLNIFGQKKDKEVRLNDMGWEIYPEGLEKSLQEIWKKYQLPIYVMENGLADANDKYRSDFIREHINFMEKAMQTGVDVRGYLHWSLMDNFEWLYGYEPRFGLVEIDYKTLERRPRKSFYVYKELIERSRS